MKFQITLLSLTIASALSSAPVASAPVSIDYSPSESRQALISNSWLEVNLSQFRANIEQFEAHLTKGTRVCAVMKADAYGNGIYGLMPIIIEKKIPCIAIASNGEAKAVRDAGFKGELVRVRSASLYEIKEGLGYDIEELVGTVEQIKEIDKLSTEQTHPIKVHLALNDGGMGRNGLDMTTDDGQAHAVKIVESPNIEIVGIMTHFPNYDADEVKKKLASFKTNTQWIFDNTSLERQDVLLHVANSYASVNVPESQLDMVRPGGVLYGDLPTNPEYPSIVSFKTRIASLHSLPAASTVGYDSTYTTKKDSVLANLPVGYSDGYPRKMGNKAHVLVNGQRAKVVGVTSMNTTMIDVSNIKGVLPGQEVILFGPQKDEAISIGEVEENADVIFPELYTIWGNANPRYYVE
jgi:alanine racemase